MLSVWEEGKIRLYGEHANVHQSHSQNDSVDLRGVAGGDGELGCLCGKAGTSHLGAWSMAMAAFELLFMHNQLDLIGTGGACFLISRK